MELKKGIRFSCLRIEMLGCRAPSLSRASLGKVPRGAHWTQSTPQYLRQVQYLCCFSGTSPCGLHVHRIFYINCNFEVVHVHDAASSRYLPLSKVELNRGCAFLLYSPRLHPLLRLQARPPSRFLFVLALCLLFSLLCLPFLPCSISSTSSSLSSNLLPSTCPIPILCRLHLGRQP